MFPLLRSLRSASASAPSATRPILNPLRANHSQNGTNGVNAVAVKRTRGPKAVIPQKDGGDWSAFVCKKTLGYKYDLGVVTPSRPIDLVPFEHIGGPAMTLINQPMNMSSDDVASSVDALRGLEMEPRLEEAISYWFTASMTRELDLSEQLSKATAKELKRESQKGMELFLEPLVQHILFNSTFGVSRDLMITGGRFDWNNKLEMELKIQNKTIKVINILDWVIWRKKTTLPMEKTAVMLGGELWGKIREPEDKLFQISSQTLAAVINAKEKSIRHDVYTFDAFRVRGVKFDFIQVSYTDEWIRALLLGDEMPSQGPVMRTYPPKPLDFCLREDRAKIIQWFYSLRQKLEKQNASQVYEGSRDDLKM